MPEDKKPVAKKPTEDNKEEKATKKIDPSSPKASKDKEEKIDRTFPAVQAGTLVRVHQEITEFNPKGEEKKRVQVFEGTVLGRKHGKGINATVTVRKESSGISVEKIFPLHSPTVKKIEVVKRFKVRRAKINYIRTKHKKLREIKD
ncbi:50S ribosomal protein L19 [Candidatus Falkowbacteria bacterium]|jgi:large subunit ribosomal protein L19|nr:50S ribosomal protein L19 [Candidatus Falkowbacteria bacterium]MBT5503735.1 50S ribosomal protein L19 [Candidatus Falkowbacteria bacterium]MBT6573786.1 50S ribosomal protein L19 [Candidatus Falkowbacteria bacterium]MBT7348124.1 50S ribosomal protein L19 [Candidatus Falkowbacteria bacterium]MBT7500710.1 50S ribosomal protein L19 [Candidatus Falkowbacteria bacterium]